jgi:hypothetical protein
VTRCRRRSAMRTTESSTVPMPPIVESGCHINRHLSDAINVFANC